MRDARRLFPPGTGFSYSNAGFSIAGAVIAAVTGQTFEAFTRERLLRPLDMTSACFTADEAITYSVATPHWIYGDRALVIRGAGWQPGWELGPVDRPAAGLIASVEHLMTWCRFQQTGTAIDGSTILSRGSLRRLHTPVVNATLHRGHRARLARLGDRRRNRDRSRRLDRGIRQRPRDRARGRLRVRRAHERHQRGDGLRRGPTLGARTVCRPDRAGPGARPVDSPSTRQRYVGRYVHSFSLLTVDPRRCTRDRRDQRVAARRRRDSRLAATGRPAVHGAVSSPLTTRCRTIRPGRSTSRSSASTPTVATMPPGCSGAVAARRESTDARSPAQAGSTITIVRPVVSRFAIASIAAGDLSNATT